MILVKTERAFARWLTGVAAQLITGEGFYVKSDKGLHVRLKNGVEYPFPVLRGQDDAQVKAPCVVVYCQLGEQLEPATMTHRVEVQLTLHFPAYESPDQTDLLEKFEFAADQLMQALYTDDLLLRVSELEDRFTLMFQLTRWIIESGWDGKDRTFKLRAQFHATPEDPLPPPVP